MVDVASLTSAVTRAARPITGAASDHHGLLEVAGGAKVVLLGGATCGSHELYAQAIAIAKRLIVDRGFGAVAFAADWLEASRLNRYVRGSSADGDAAQALGAIRRFPLWIWRNADVLDFIGWLRAHNDSLADERWKVGVYGLDLQGLSGAFDSILRATEGAHPQIGSTARSRFDAFHQAGEDGGALPIPPALASAIAARLKLERRAELAMEYGPNQVEEAALHEQQMRRADLESGAYVRSLLEKPVVAHNAYQRDMFETLHAVLGHLERRGVRPKVVVLGHLRDVGDCRATQASEVGELSVGQLVRERFPGQALVVGLTTHHGTVTAASRWDGPIERKRLQPALPGSFEAILHASEIPRFSLVPGSVEVVRGRGTDLADERLERTIGPVYEPQAERRRHYLYARLAKQLDMIVHVDETRAVEPLDTPFGWVPPPDDAP